ncbi:hypothetical protein C8J57DRAFT_1232312 [Mycena rebaudengoi]|nr:hypothetical protein C8J57DRAFT_1232312 [Mycena rebaudengoi]
MEVSDWRTDHCLTGAGASQEGVPVPPRRTTTWWGEKKKDAKKMGTVASLFGASHEIGRSGPDFDLEILAIAASAPRMPGFLCEYCFLTLPTSQGLVSHLSQSEECHQKVYEAYAARSSWDDDSDDGGQPGAEEFDGLQDHVEDVHGMDTDSGLDLAGGDRSVEDVDVFADPPSPSSSTSGLPAPGPQVQKCPRATVEEVEDEDDEWVQDFPEEFQAGATFGSCQTQFEKLRDEQEKAGLPPWAPFESEDEWELARWLMTSGLSQTKTDDYLKLKTLTGDELDDEGKPKKQIVELWHRDPVECARELLGNPMFTNQEYVPRRVFKNRDSNSGAYSNRVYSEMWTADWWWKVQKLLPKGSTLAPIIISTDKTQLTRFSGDQQAWPVYLTIGNIDKETRRTPSSRATVLLGYIPVCKLEIFLKKRRSSVQYQLFHDCMRVVLGTLRAAGKDGVLMDCADGFVRKMFPILSAYIADYPEQCLVVCCKENSCPRCLVAPKKRGEKADSPWRTQTEALRVLGEKSRNEHPPEFTTHNMRAINPFWADFPHCDIFSCITPDILHELHNGVFGEHWTGTERKNMEKVFLGVIANTTDPRVQLAVWGIIDFIYYAHFETHLDQSLALLDAAWASFHDNKEVFLILEIRTHFDINKLHKLKHYLDSIRSRGTLDGFNTENTERLHIDLAKVGYVATNKKAYTNQMTVWLRRQQSIHKFATYLQWAVPGYVADKESDAVDNGDDPPAPVPVAVEPEDSDDEGELEDVTVSTPLASLPAYSIAKKPGFPKLTVESITTDFHAPDFLINLHRFFDTQSLKTPYLYPHRATYVLTDSGKNWSNSGVCPSSQADGRRAHGRGTDVRSS